MGIATGYLVNNGRTENSHEKKCVVVTAINTQEVNELKYKKKSEGAP